MGRRRRSLLQNRRRAGADEAVSHDEREPAATLPADEPTELDPASPRSEGQPPTPGSTFPPVDAAPVAPPEALIEEPTVRMDVNEVPYSPVGAVPHLDTTDEGWESTQSLPPPTDEVGPQSIPPIPATPIAEVAPFSPPDVVPPVPRVSVPNVEPSEPPTVGGFDDVAPPTEEVPNAVLQDISQPYSAPMHVPEPPPIPGILDRFTPAGAAPRSRRRNAKIERRPSYIAATPTPPPMLRRLEEMETTPAPRKARVVEEETYEPNRRALPFLFVLAGIFVVVFLVLSGLIATGIWSNQRSEDDVDVVEPVPMVPAPVPPPVPEPVVEPRPVEPEPDGVEVSEPTPSAPVPVAPATPRPVRPRPVRPIPPDPAPAPAPVAKLGTVKIKSNRRVMVYVGGKAIGFTPASYRAKPGEVAVSAMLPRQPQSKQTQSVTVRGGETRNVDFTF